MYCLDYAFLEEWIMFVFQPPIGHCFFALQIAGSQPFSGIPIYQKMGNVLAPVG